MSKIKKVKFYDPVYGCLFTLVIGGGTQDGYDYFTRCWQTQPNEDFSSSTAEGATFIYEGRGGVGFWFRTLKDPSIVAHEAAHGALWVLVGHGVSPISWENDEHFCYYLQFLTEKILSYK